MIGIFDSGIGGLSIFREIRKILPEETYIYYSDNAHCPYGEKTKEYIIDRAITITEFLLSKGADIIIVACNTATAAAIATLRERYPDIPFIGMEPAIKPAARKTRSGVVGVLATAGTLKAEKYQGTREKWTGDIKVVEHVGEGFVELVESGRTTGEEVESIVSKSLKPLLDEGADTIVLGCTHYPFLSEALASTAGILYPEREIEIIDSAPAVARHVFDVMSGRGLISGSDGTFGISLYSSGSDSLLKETYKNLL